MSVKNIEIFLRFVLTYNVFVIDVFNVVIFICLFIYLSSYFHSLKCLPQTSYKQ